MHMTGDQTKIHPLWPELNHHRIGCARTFVLVVSVCALVTLISLVNLGHRFGTNTPYLWLLHYFHVALPVSSIATFLTLFYGLIVPLAFKQPVPRMWRPVVHAVIIVLSVVIGGEVGTRLTVLFGSVVPIETIRFYVIINGLLFVTIVVVMGSFVDRVRSRTEEAERRTERSKHAAVLARIRALQARINPHFLFNSLNTVASLIEEDPKLAEQTLEKLAEIYQYVVQSSKKRQVSLSEEFEALEAYLDIQATRFEGRLESTVELPSKLRNIQILPLTLQPLVENAVKHGVEQQREVGKIVVEAKLSFESLVLTVEDNGPGPRQSQHCGSQTSLEDLRKRLQLAYGDSAKVDQDRGPLGGFRIQLTLPKNLPEDTHAD